MHGRTPRGQWVGPPPHISDLRRCTQRGIQLSPTQPVDIDQSQPSSSTYGSYWVMRGYDLGINRVGGSFKSGWGGGLTLAA